MRLQRILADAGIAARRDCEALILERRVRVNGRVVDRLPAFADPRADRIEVDGRPIPPPEEPVVILAHKPERVLSTVEDEPGMERRTVLNLIDHPIRARLVPAGRLEYDASGLVVLSNDGEIVNRLTHPRYRVPKVYDLAVRGTISDDTPAKFLREFRDLTKRDAARKGGPRPARTPPPTVEIVRQEGDLAVLRVTTEDGRPGPVVDALLKVGLDTRKTIRFAIGPLNIKGIAVGQWRALMPRELHVLRKYLERDPERRTSAPVPVPKQAAKPRAPRRGVRPETAPRPARKKPEAPAPADAGSRKPRTILPE